jgi:hypothetical protein
MIGMMRSATFIATIIIGASARTTVDDLNQWLVSAEYAVRGEILDRSEALQKQLDANEKVGACLPH